MKAENIEGVVIRVKDLEKAAKFFSEVFGIEFNSPSESKEIGGIMMIGRPLGGARIGITVLAPSTPDGAVARTLERRGEGLQVLSLKVTNVAEATAALKSRGVRQIGGDGTTMFQSHPQDLFGVVFELWPESELAKRE